MWKGKGEGWRGEVMGARGDVSWLWVWECQGCRRAIVQAGARIG